MACEKRPYFYAILVLCILALLFHIAGFVTPGWLIMRRHVEDISIFEMRGQLIDHGGLTVPPEIQGEDAEPETMFRKKRSHNDEDSEESHRPPHHGSHPPPKPTGKPGFTKDPDMMEECEIVESWLMEAMAEIETFDVQTSYGLWKTRVCISERKMGDFDSEDSEEKHMVRDRRSSSDDSDDSDDDDDEDRRGHSRCMKMSTKCALKYSFLYDSSLFFTSNGGYLSYKNFGYASLKEHRIENSLVLAFMVLGLISAIGGFRKVNGCRCAGVACVIFMSLAAFIAFVPVSRLSLYSVNRTNQGSPVKVHAPYSVIATGVGSIFALIAALVAGFALVKERSGKWYQFNNKLELPNEKKEKPGLYFTAEALPAKPGLYDVCDFGDIKPIDQVKKPEAEEEPDELVL